MFGKLRVWDTEDNNGVLIYLLLAAIYFILCFSLTQVARMLEKRVTNRRAGLPAGASSPSLPVPAAGMNP